MFNPIITASLQEAQNLLTELISDEMFVHDIKRIASQIASVFQHKGKLIIFGNGGSMCDAMHFAEELTGRYHLDREALPAIAISDASHLSCVANDFGYDSVFSRAVEAYAVSGDMVIGISTSGNSANVINALKYAQKRECFTFALLGKDGGALKDGCDFQIIVPSANTARIQEIHSMIIHILIELIEAELFTKAGLQDTNPIIC
ncbi:MAG: D-sedoheptulose 7-phosphate isomerase [Candidatus Cloacimonetes bacterium]|nr:D-sedoheptulose 7-phosphate isomerase [Candidatus Cloacimonadota bacterium]